VYSKSEKSVPPYKYYRTIDQSIIASNRKHILTRPYLEDIPDEEKDGFSDVSDTVLYSDEHEDVDESETDAVLIYLTSKCGYKARYKKRFEQLDLLAKAQSYETVMEYFLEELGCGFKDVLYYLLRPDLAENPMVAEEDWAKYADRQPFCHANFDRNRDKWQRVLSGLQASTDAELAAAGLACYAVWKTLGFSLWHIARNSDAAREAYERTKEPEDEETLDQYECAICHLFLCPHHGINLQRKDEHREIPSNRSSKWRSKGKTGKRRSKKTASWYVTSDEDDINNVRYLARSETLESPARATTPASDMHHGFRNLRIGPDTAKFMKPFQPCSHRGPCSDESQSPGCRCVAEGIPCEKHCGCSKDCARRFPGCKCASMKRPCSTDACLCRKLNRECDPDVCLPCHAAEVLHPATEADEDQQQHCNNVPIQLGRRKHTIIGRSQVKGFGLYAMEPIKKHDFVGEYSGELMTNNEMIRRQTMEGYRRENTYLFDIYRGKLGVRRSVKC
jgi:hypothetical protein